MDREGRPSRPPLAGVPGESPRRHGRGSTLGLYVVAAAVVLLVGGCTGGDAGPATSAVVPVSTPATAASTSPSGPPASAPAAPAPLESAWQSFEVVPAPTVDSVDHWVVGETGTVAVGWTQQLGQSISFLDRTGATSMVLLTDLFGTDRAFTPSVSDAIWWQGQYWLFLMGDEAALLGAPTALVSVDGETWKRRLLGSAGGARPGSLLATPESPPWPADSGVAAAEAGEFGIVAAGWTTVGGTSIPMVWTTKDGSTWSSSALPVISGQDEWAADVAVGPHGYLVHTFGAFYQSPQLLWSTDGVSWLDVSLRGVEAFAIASTRAGLVASTAQRAGPPYGLVRWTGAEWTPMPAPPGLIFDLADSPDGLVALVASNELAGTSVWTLPPGSSTWVLNMEGGQFVSDLVVDAAGPRVTEARLDGTFVRWQLPAIYRVTLVADDDVLNVRDAPMGRIITELPPGTGQILALGPERYEASGRWLLILTGDLGTIGWANARYLSTGSPSFTSDPQVDTVLDALAAVAAGTGDWSAVAGSDGFAIEHFGQDARMWPAGADPFQDPRVYEWSQEAGEPPWPMGTVAEMIGTSFLDAYGEGDTVLLRDEPISGPEAAPSYLPTIFEGLHYVAVHDPGDDPSIGRLDWITWYVYFDWTPDGWRAVGMSMDSWAP